MIKFDYRDVVKGREHDSRDGGGRVAPGAATEDAEALTTLNDLTIYPLLKKSQNSNRAP